MLVVKICKISDCNDRHYGKGFCRTHYLIAKRSTPEYKKYHAELSRRKRLEHKQLGVVNSKKCTLENCNEPHHSKGMCKHHYYKNSYKNNRDKILNQTSDYVKRNPDKRKAYIQFYNEKNKETRVQYSRDHYILNKEKRLDQIAQWRQANTGKVRAYYAKRHKAVKNQTPKSLNKTQLEEIECIYGNRPIGFEVDHIVPLQGKNVSGLHVPWNLQYLPIIENRKKSNKFNG